MIKIHNVTTGEIIERELNADELSQRETDILIEAAREQAEAQKAADKAALLTKLGINESEAKLLLS